MFGAIVKATNSYFQKGMTFCRSIYVKKVMKLLVFIFEQPSYKKEHSNIYYHSQTYEYWGVYSKVLCLLLEQCTCTL